MLREFTPSILAKRI